MLENQHPEYLRGLFSETRVKLQIVERTTVPLTWTSPDRIYDYDRLYFILDGQGWVRIGDQLLYPQPGHLVLLPAGLTVAFGTMGVPTYTKYWCHFTAMVGEVSLFQLVQAQMLIRAPEPDKLTLLFETLIGQANSQRPTSPLRVQATLLDLVSYFFELSVVSSAPSPLSLHQSEPRSGDNLAATIQQVLKYMGEHLDNPLSVQQLAAQVHFHPNYFIKVFRSLLGVSPMQYLNRLRLERAKQVLISDRRSVADVARMVGMDAHYLARRFRQYTGYSPTEFRALVMNSQSNRPR